MSVLDASTLSVTDTIMVGGFLGDVAVSPNGSLVYVTIQSTNSVAAIDTSTNTVTSTVAVGTSPRSVRFTPDGSRAYVANDSPADPAGSVSVIDAATHSVTATITVGRRPQAIAITPGGTKAYVANSETFDVSVIDTSTDAVVATIGAAGRRPRGVAMEPLPPATGLPVLDQSNEAPVTAGTALSSQSSSSLPPDMVAQAMTFGLSGLFDSVDLSLRRFDTTAGDILLEIHETSGGVPTDVVLVSKSFVNSEIALATEDFTHFDLRSLGLRVESGDVLAVAVSSPNQNGSLFPVALTDDDGYLRGDLYQSIDSGASWFKFGSREMRFRVFVARPIVFDFADRAYSGFGVGPTKNTYEANGFTFTGFSSALGVGGDAEALTSMGSDTPGAYPGSAALLNRFFFGTTLLTKDDGGLFDVLSLDVSESNNESGNAFRTLTFIGTRPDGSTVTSTITTDGAFGFQTISFSGMTDLASLYWSPFSTHTDNVSVILSAVDDRDGDTVPDELDNCPDDANPLQEDVDLDLVGDVCDACPADAANQCNSGGSVAAEVSSADGGSVVTPDGSLSLVLDSGDLAEDATLSVTQTVPSDPEVDLTLGPNPGLGKAVAVYDLEPDGIEFVNPVTLTIVADVTSLNPNQRSRLDLYLFSDSDGDGVPDTFISVGATCDVLEDPVDVFTATCTAEILHFSTYAMLAPLDSDDDGVADTFGDEIDLCESGLLVVDGFSAPLAALVPSDAGEAPLPENAFKQGRTVPLKLRLLCGTAALTDEHVTPPEIDTLTRTAAAADLTTVDLDSGVSNDDGTSFRFSDDKWIYNLSTRELETGTYSVTFRTPEGILYVGRFVLK